MGTATGNERKRHSDQNRSGLQECFQLSGTLLPLGNPQRPRGPRRRLPRRPIQHIVDENYGRHALFLFLVSFQTLSCCDSRWCSLTDTHAHVHARAVSLKFSLPHPLTHTPTHPYTDHPLTTTPGPGDLGLPAAKGACARVCVCVCVCFFVHVRVRKKSKESHNKPETEREHKREQ